MNEPQFSVLGQGLMIGLAAAAPIGPSSIFCMQKALTKGMVSGFVSSTGAATAAAIQAGIGAFSLNLVASSLADHKDWFNLISGAFLCYLGITIFLSRSNTSNTRMTSSPKGLGGRTVLLRDYGAALLLTSINPLSILPFVAFFTQFYSAASHPDYGWAGAFVLGVFISSVLWFGLISLVASLFSHRVLLRQFRWVNRIAGTTIAIFGSSSIYSTYANLK